MRGIAKEKRNGLDHYKSVILSHIGRATTEKQLEDGGKWRFYSDFRKSLELLGFDKLVLNARAGDCIRQSRTVILVEGAFDVAKLIEAGFYNVVASFGAGLSVEQSSKLKWLSEFYEGVGILVWYDRDEAGKLGQASAIEKLRADGLPAKGFDWNGLPTSVNSKALDVCELGTDDLQVLETNGLLQV